MSSPSADTTSGHAAGEARSLFFRRERVPVDLRDHLAGAPAFLVLNGPSLGQVDLRRLDVPGVLTMCLNNGPRALRPDLWLTCDPPARFLPSIWRDPRILKFARAHYHHASLHELDARARGYEPEVRACFRSQLEAQEAAGNGAARNHRQLARDCPRAVWFEDTCHHFDAATFLTGPKVTIGDREVRSSMLAALRVLYELGVREVYLLGCDFHMRKEQPYGFREPVSDRHVERNNHYYGLLNERFQELQPHFAAHGLRVVNLNPSSGLRAFPMADFEVVLDHVTGSLHHLMERERSHSFYVADPSQSTPYVIDLQTAAIRRLADPAAQDQPRNQSVSSP